MEKTIIGMVPDWRDLVALEPEELAGVLIVHLNSLSPNEHQRLIKHNFFRGPAVLAYAREAQGTVGKALAEAWAWLERECLIAAQPADVGNMTFITRRGQKFVERSDYDAYRRASALPRAMLHPILDARCFSSFLRGEYDTAIFAAFREIEVAVRRAGGFTLEDYGVPLMRAAFAPGTGPLADTSSPTGEQEAMSHLFAGAIGLYKNAASHRVNLVSDPTAAIEIILLANHLLRIVESRTQTASP